MDADYSVFYYTYSTIAQTLAGAFGFLVAVVLYQVQSMSRGLPEQAKNIYGALGEKSETIENALRDQRWIDFGRDAERIGAREGESDDFRDAVHVGIIEFTSDALKCDRLKSKFLTRIATDGDHDLGMLYFYAHH